jgi:hypothetical protein
MVPGRPWGAPKAFVEVEIFSNTTDYPRQFNVQVSNNGSTWTTVTAATGSSSHVQVPFAQQQARYVRIQLATSGQQYWISIYDFNVYSTQHPTTTWSPTSSGFNQSDSEPKAIDGSLSTKWTSSTNQSPNGQWYQVDMRTKQTFSGVSLDGGSSSTTYPRGYKIEASNDASTWSTLATGTGAAGVILASFTTTQARYRQGDADGDRLGEVVALRAPRLRPARSSDSAVADWLDRHGVETASGRWKAIDSTESDRLDHRSQPAGGRLVSGGHGCVAGGLRHHDGRGYVDELCPRIQRLTWATIR